MRLLPWTLRDPYLWLQSPDEPGGVGASERGCRPQSSSCSRRTLLRMPSSSRLTQFARGIGLAIGLALPGLGKGNKLVATACLTVDRASRNGALAKANPGPWGAGAVRRNGVMGGTRPALGS
jgi:hypothetical protein